MESNDQDANEDSRIPPLNLNEEEASYLWEMMQREVGREDVQYGDGRETAESLHTKVRALQPGLEGDDGE